jgi:hypothetical protein
MAQQADAKDKLYFNVLEKEVTLKDLDNKIKILTVENSEMQSLKPDRKVYMRRSNILFLADPKQGAKEKADDLQKMKQEREKIVFQIQKDSETMRKL